MEMAEILAAMEAMKASFSTYHNELRKSLSDFESRLSTHTNITSFSPPPPTDWSPDPGLATTLRPIFSPPDQPAFPHPSPNQPPWSNSSIDSPSVAAISPHLYPVAGPQKLQLPFATPVTTATDHSPLSPLAKSASVPDLLRHRRAALPPPLPSSAKPFPALRSEACLSLPHLLTKNSPPTPTVDFPLSLGATISDLCHPHRRPLSPFILRVFYGQALIIWAEEPPGSDEGLFAWVVANYALGTLGAKPAQTTVIIELGNVSVALISNEPISPEFPRKVKFGNFTGSLYSPHREKRMDPCTPRGYAPEKEAWKDSPSLIKEESYLSTFHLNGNSSECRSVFLKLLQKSQNKYSHHNCYIGSTFMPKFQGKFLATENFFHNSKLFKLHQRSLLYVMVTAGERFCGEDWSKLKQSYKYFEQEDLITYCFYSTYIVSLLHDSLGIALDNSRVEYASEVDSIPLDGALGAFILHWAAAELTGCMRLISDKKPPREEEGLDGEWANIAQSNCKMQFLSRLEIFRESGELHPTEESISSHGTKRGYHIKDEVETPIFNDGTYSSHCQGIASVSHAHSNEDLFYLPRISSVSDEEIISDDEIQKINPQTLRNDGDDLTITWSEANREMEALVWPKETARSSSNFQIVFVKEKKSSGGGWGRKKVKAKFSFPCRSDKKDQSLVVSDSNEGASSDNIAIADEVGSATDDETDNFMAKSQLNVHDNQILPLDLAHKHDTRGKHDTREHSMAEILSGYPEKNDLQEGSSELERQKRSIERTILESGVSPLDDNIQENGDLHEALVSVTSFESEDEEKAQTVKPILVRILSRSLETKLIVCSCICFGDEKNSSTEQLNLQVLSMAWCSMVFQKCLPFMNILGKTLVGLNIQLCYGFSSVTINLLLEQLWSYTYCSKVTHLLQELQGNHHLEDKVVLKTRGVDTTLRTQSWSPSMESKHKGAQEDVSPSP